MAAPVGFHMKYKAIFLDFYGTLVHEDDEIVAELTQKMSACSPQNPTAREVGAFWWAALCALFDNSHGCTFQPQRELELISIAQTLAHFQCEDLNFDAAGALFSHWTAPGIFADTKPFLAQNTRPICIVSNIDRSDILQAIHFHGLHFEHLVTSEDAASYKPRSEIFHMALEKMQLAPGEVLHVGDSYRSDIAGAHNCGIDSFWLNRKGRATPEGCLATHHGTSLLDVLRCLG